MSDITAACRALVNRMLVGEGRASPAVRRAAFERAGVPGPLRVLVDKVATRAHTVTDEDVAAALASGLTEDQVFEVVVCAAVGQATRQHESALAALAVATGSR